MPTVETNDVETYYETYGDGPPLVFVHGAFGDHQFWAEQARPLADDYRVVVYDLRGHGLTGGSELPTYTPALLASDLRGLVDALGLGAPVVVGFSLGGSVAQAYAAGHPDGLSGLVLLGATAPRTLTRMGWFERVVLSRVRARLLGRPRLLGAYTSLTARLYGDGEDHFDEATAERLREAHPDGDPEVPLAEQRKLLDASRRFLKSSVDPVAVDVPALVLYGEHESVIAEHARHLGAVLPVADVQEVPDAGHNCHVDDPDFVRDAIRTYLAAVPGYAADGVASK
jgi:pimeloyl-ACP methyl ester carboxylesterase